MSGDVAEIAKGLSEAQRKAVFPGPGNAKYARGSVVTMRALYRRGITQHQAYSACLLSELGLAVRAYLLEQDRALGREV